MRQARSTLTIAAVAAVLGACGFEDPTPDTLRFKMTGDAGVQVEAIYARQFVAGVTETGVTEVQVFQSDTAIHTLPVDTVMNIAVERRWFVQVTPVSADTATVGVQVDIDDRNILQETGGLFASDPWRYVYLFNQTVTRSIDVVF